MGQGGVRSREHVGIKTLGTGGKQSPLGQAGVWGLIPCGKGTIKLFFKEKKHDMKENWHFPSKPIYDFILKFIFYVFSTIRTSHKSVVSKITKIKCLYFLGLPRG